MLDFSQISESLSVPSPTPAKIEVFRKSNAPDCSGAWTSFGVNPHSNLSVAPTHTGTDVVSASGKSMREKGIDPLRTVTSLFDARRDSARRVAEPEGGYAASDFVKASDGSIDFGEITSGQAKAMRRQAGKIRLAYGIHNSDGTGYGLIHIEANHGRQIRSAGFTSVENFVSHIAKDFGQIWQAVGRQVLVAYRDNEQHMMYMQLEQAEDDAGEYYRVNTAFPVRQDNYPEKHGFKKLWDGSEPTSAVPGEQPAFASQPDNLSGQAAPNARGSREFNIRQPAEKYNTDSGDTPMQTSLTKSLGNKRILFFKSNIAAYTSRLGVFVPAHTDKRTNRSEAKHDSLTADMFSVPIPPTPKRDIPVEAMKKPEDFTPDMFTGKTKADIHHLDLPWEPASMQQRNGRGLRQGNTNKGVRIHNYLAKGSFDGYRSGS